MPNEETGGKYETNRPPGLILEILVELHKICY